MFEEEVGVRVRRGRAEEREIEGLLFFFFF